MVVDNLQLNLMMVVDNLQLNLILGYRTYLYIVFLNLQMTLMLHF